MSKREYEQTRGSGHSSPKRVRTEEASDLPQLNSVFHGEVASVQKYGVFVKLPGYKRQGLVHISQMSSARIEDPAEMLAKGEMVYCKVINVETEGAKIGLSMKLVNQTTGKDLDPNNVQSSLDEKKRKKFFAGGRPPIELGAVYDTTCRTCGGHGHLAMECFVGRGGKQYDLVPDLEDMDPSVPEPSESKQARSTHRKKKEKKKRHKKEKKKKKRKHHSDTSDSSESDRDSKLRKSTKNKQRS